MEAPRRQPALVACPVRRCIYMHVFDSRAVHRVDTDGQTPWTTWSTDDVVHGLVATPQGTVLMTCSWECSGNIREYTTHGVLIRNIAVRPRELLFGLVLLPGGQMGVKVIGGYCVVAGYGQVVRCIRYTQSPLFTSFSLMSAMADGLGRTYFADAGESRIVVVEPGAVSASELPIDTVLARPQALHVDQARGRLYIGENGGQQRIIVLGV